MTSLFVMYNAWGIEEFHWWRKKCCKLTRVINWLVKNSRVHYDTVID